MKVQRAVMAGIAAGLVTIAVVDVLTAAAINWWASKVVQRAEDVKDAFETVMSLLPSEDYDPLDLAPLDIPHFVPATLDDIRLRGF